MKKNHKRSKKKILRKLRWYYLKFFQTKKRRLWLYRSYRHYRYHGKDQSGQLSDGDFYLTKEVHPGAGIGDQLASWISGFYYAKQLGVSYAHSRFYPEKWERFLNFGRGEQKAEELIQRGYKKVWLPLFKENDNDELQFIKKIMSSYCSKKIVFYLELDQIYTQQYGISSVLKEKFNQEHHIETEELIYQKDSINIAVHIRRGDIEQGLNTGDNELAQRWLDNRYYVRILEQILPLLCNKRYNVYIFSQGKKKDFQEFADFSNMHYCMDMPAMDTFLHMVRADILVTSKSSFSYKPALISDGIKICPCDFWHGYPKSEDWILADAGGELDLKRMEQAIWGLMVLKER